MSRAPVKAIVAVNHWRRQLELLPGARKSRYVRELLIPSSIRMMPSPWSVAASAAGILPRPKSLYKSDFAIPSPRWSNRFVPSHFPVFELEEVANLLTDNRRAVLINVEAQR